jgi:hypothetical protein
MAPVMIIFVNMMISSVGAGKVQTMKKEKDIWEW